MVVHKNCCNWSCWWVGASSFSPPPPPLPSLCDVPRAQAYPCTYGVGEVLHRLQVGTCLFPKQSWFIGSRDHGTHMPVQYPWLGWV